ncbi:MAG: DUF4129 domain-containing protein, partial [Thermoplasmatota archaeon]
KLECARKRYCISTEDPFGASVLMVYKNFSKLAATKGLIRHISETPRQFCIRTTALPTMPPDALFGLLEIVEKALYSDSKMSEEQRTLALECERAIEHSLPLESAKTTIEVPRKNAPALIAPPYQSEVYTEVEYPPKSSLRLDTEKDSKGLFDLSEGSSIYLSKLVSQYIFEILYRAREVFRIPSTDIRRTAALIMEQAKLKARIENKFFLVPDHIKLAAMDVIPHEYDISPDNVRDLLDSVQAPFMVFKHEIG